MALNAKRTTHPQLERFVWPMSLFGITTDTTSGGKPFQDKSEINLKVAAAPFRC